MNSNDISWINLLLDRYRIISDCDPLTDHIFSLSYCFNSRKYKWTGIVNNIQAVTDINDAEWIIFLEGSSDTATFIGKFYLGYSLTPIGSIIGFIWGLIDGAIGGAIFALIYNKFKN